MDTAPIDVQADLDRLAVQEQQLQFDTFTADTAWQLGTRLKEAAEAAGKAVAIEIQLAGQPLFFYAMPGTTADNADWIRRKRNVVLRFHRSSYAVGLDLQQRQTSLQERSGLDLRDYAPFGGCFPLILRGTGCVGTLAVSGLPQRDDHALLVAVLADWFGLPLAGLDLS